MTVPRRATTIVLIAAMVAGCVVSDTGLKQDPAPAIYTGIGPQSMVCSHHNCCAILYGYIECQGEADVYGLTTDAPTSGGWVGLESSPRYLCAWDVVGEWTCWGDSPNPLPAQAPDVRVADMRLGTAGGIALLPDGSITLWGSDLFGQITDAPSLAGTYIAVEAGYGWRCAAEDTGDLICWGIEDGEGVDYIEHAQTSDAPVAHGFRGLNRGVGDVLSGIDINDRVYSWGGGYSFVGPLNDTIAANVAPSDNYVCAQLPGGALACSGALLEPFEVGADDTLAQPISPVTNLACGHRWCCALAADTFECWGDGQAQNPLD